MRLECSICGFSETTRPKKWWPEFTFICCDQHGPGELPELAPGLVRSEYAGIGSRFIGFVDVAVPDS